MNSGDQQVGYLYVSVSSLRALVVSFAKGHFTAM